MKRTCGLSEETESGHQKQARLEERSLRGVSLRLSQDKSIVSVPIPLLSIDDWIRRFDAWVSSHQARNPQFDDSRDTLYPETD